MAPEPTTHGPVSPSALPPRAPLPVDPTPAPVPEPVPRDALERELGPSTFFRTAGKSGCEIHVLDGSSAPMALYEVGRLRELTFRDAGGGTGAALDLDSADMHPDGYKQLVVWNPVDREIVGGYRFALGRDVCRRGVAGLLGTSKLFAFSAAFVEHYLPRSIELGRSFVQPRYQAGAGRAGIYALDDLWHGLGGLCAANPDVAYFFGKVTTYPSMNARARDLLLAFLARFFPDPERLLRPFAPSPVPDLPGEYDGLDAKAGLRLLRKDLLALGHGVPPLIRAYMELSTTMKTFGTAVNHAFGNTEETGILITIADINPAKLDRHARPAVARPAAPS